MSASNVAFLQGRITNIEAVTIKNILKYEIRVDVKRPKKKDLDADEKALLYDGAIEYKKNDFFKIVAYPSSDHDPWKDLARGMTCRFECELRNPDGNIGQCIIEALSVCVVPPEKS